MQCISAKVFLQLLLLAATMALVPAVSLAQDMDMEPWVEFKPYEPIPEPPSVSLPAYEERDYPDYDALADPNRPDPDYNERDWRGYESFDSFDQSDYRPVTSPDLAPFSTFDPYEPFDPMN